MRIFAIINWWKDREDSVKEFILDKLEARPEDKIYVFYNEANGPKDNHDNIEFVPVAKENGGQNRASIKNFAYRFVKERYSSGMLYMIEDSIHFEKNPTEFYEALENMMDIFDLDLWFNTYTDVCNRIFNKFDGRCNITIDKEHFGIDEKLILTSNCNPTVSAYDLSKVKYETLFDESFVMPMFWILKFLAERRNNKVHPLMFMNNYITIPEEIGVFKEQMFKTDEVSMEMQIKEHKQFMEMKINLTPDNDLDKILETLTDFLVKKFKKD